MARKATGGKKRKGRRPLFKKQKKGRKPRNPEKKIPQKEDMAETRSAK